MMCCQENKSNQINLIIGDTLNKDFAITGVNLELIKDVYFVCSDLKINKRLEKYFYEDNSVGFSLNISSEETTSFNSCATDYDIKMIMVDNSVYTISYRSNFNVMKNKNSLAGDIND